MGSANEFALTAWSEDTDRSSIRIDRRFHAGPAPLTPGDEFLWIVDYKTATHGPQNLDEFLAAEREKYRAQLDVYAQILQRVVTEHAAKEGTKPRELRVALYYPLLPKLLWWTPELA
jgi:ATP-dependent helicase/nuclease subunit A